MSFLVKDQKDNKSDLFLQPPLQLLLFTKVANISGGHCVFNMNFLQKSL